MVLAQSAVMHTPIVVGPGLSPLEGARIDVAIDDLMAEFTLTQSFRNTTADDIEAVFTFPVPLDAIYLGLNARLGERELEGRIVEKQQARLTYETAISKGDSAVLVERAEAGLLTSNVGNLRPGETLELRLRFGQWLSFNGRRVSFRVPTTIAPRYGRSDLDPREAPVTDLLAQYGFAAEVAIRGLLTRAELHSPSHLLVLRREGEAVSLSLTAGAMDRDFLLDAEFGAIERCSVTSDRDDEGQIVSVAMVADVPSQQRPLDLVLVVDCSGSMEGASIAQARHAMREILGRMGGTDRIDLIRYGSGHQAVFGQLRALDRDTRSLLEEQVAATDANLGGTETVAALTKAADLLVQGGKGSERDRVIFLVTDGAIESPRLQALQANCRKHGLRIFVVGVGLSVGEAAIRAFAESTDGVAELVHPNQDMAAHVVRHFERVRAPAARIRRIDWPEMPRWVHAPTTFSSGDTVRVFAAFDRPVEGEVVVHWQATDPQQLRLPFRRASGEPNMSTLSRMAAQRHVDTLSERDEQVALAVRYQLLTNLTSAVLVASRADGNKASDLPTTVTVPQMMAAGSSGHGRMVACASRHSAVNVPTEELFSFGADDHHLDLPAFMRRPIVSKVPTRAAPPAPLERLTAKGAEQFEALLRWMEHEIARLLAAGGDLEAGFIVLLLRLRRTEHGRSVILDAVFARPVGAAVTEFLGAMLAIKAMPEIDVPTASLDRLVELLRQRGREIVPRADLVAGAS